MVLVPVQNVDAYKKETEMLKSKLIAVCIVLIAAFYCQPAWCESVVAGPVEITPGNATLFLEMNGSKLELSPSFNFVLKNRSSSDIKLMLIAEQINAYDNFNQQLFQIKLMKSTGAPMSYNDGIEEIFSDEKNDFVTLSPNQQIQIFVNRNTSYGGIRIEDKSKELYKTYRPTSACFNGAVGIINLDGTTELRTFSLMGMPLSVMTR